MKRTYLDTNVLIEVFQGRQNEYYRRIMEVLNDPLRQWVVSDFLALELLPKPTFYRREEEVEFMQTFLRSAAQHIAASSQVVQKAIYVASSYDVAPMDALHVAAAWEAHVDEFLTLEKPSHPICRVQEISIRSLLSPV
jgi:predicted nucleic acid-binding protein